jgi:apolipoprotein N-acyltransferase
MRFFYAFLSGILLSLPWYSSFSGLFLLIAFIPLLLIEDHYFKFSQKTGKEVFLYASLTFFIWNCATTWWIANSSVIGCLTAVFVNTFLFSLIFWLYHIVRKKAGNFIGSLAFVAFWTGFEYFYLNAEISWPWLNLGNGFANDIKLIQWYEFTGALGGTVWVLIVNIAIFRILTEKFKLRNQLISFILTGLLIFVPPALSLFRYQGYEEKKNLYHIVILQPNINPYTYLPTQYLCGNLLHLADSLSNSSTEYILAPEAAIEDEIWENNLLNNYSIPELSRFVNRFPHVNFITGARTYKEYPLTAHIPATAKPLNKSAGFYDCFSSAIQIDSSQKIQLYHKSKLVVGVEKMPYPNALKWLKKTVVRFGGSFSSFGTQSYRSVLQSADGKLQIAPVICYESAYGEFVTGYIKNGASLIFILTNDAWWKNTPGHIQLLNYARLRAIETRRSIARSANTGISAFINQRGDIISSLDWGIKGGLTAELNANSYQTLYVRYGDYLGKMAYLVSGCILLIFTLFVIFKK